MTKRNQSVQVSFMLVGHTKFVPDRFFGLFKRQFCRATVDSMYDIVHVMKESSIAGKNIPNPIVDQTGRRNCTWYDWSSFLGEYFCTIPDITKYITTSLCLGKYVGEIVCKEYSDSPEVDSIVGEEYLSRQLLAMTFLPL